MEYVILVLLIIILVCLIILLFRKNNNETEDRINKLEISMIKEISDFKNDFSPFFIPLPPILV